jgi:hypothetical protein
MSFERELFRWPPLRLARMCREHASVVVVRPLVLDFVRRVEEGEVGSGGRAIGLDVPRDLCEVAMVEGGALRSAGRIATTPERLELFASSLAPSDRVALEATGSAWEIARILEPHVARVVVVSPADTGIRQALAKTDRLDARTLARRLAAAELDAVWSPDDWTRVLRRRLGRRAQLVASPHAREERDPRGARASAGRAPAGV